MSFLGMVLLAASLCADCFAVTLCSSVTLKKIEFRRVAFIALSFALIQAGLMFAGWAFGDLFVGFVSSFADIIAFLLLLYVGGSMIMEGVRYSCELRKLNSLKNILLGGFATSIDALAVGISLSMGSMKLTEMIVQAAIVFVVTVLSVILGIFGGKTIGKHVGRVAEIAGGAVLIIIGISILF